MMIGPVATFVEVGLVSADFCFLLEVATSALELGALRFAGALAGLVSDLGIGLS
jgi:hypothetical protein